MSEPEECKSADKWNCKYCKIVSTCSIHSEPQPAKVMTDFTHKKRSYKALAVEWTGENTDLVLSMLDNAKLHPNTHCGSCIIIRDEFGIGLLNLGGYVVRRENGTVRTYKNKEEFDIQYEPILEVGEQTWQ